MNSIILFSNKPFVFFYNQYLIKNDLKCKKNISPKFSKKKKKILFSKLSFSKYIQSQLHNFFHFSFIDKMRYYSFCRQEIIINLITSFWTF